MVSDAIKKRKCSRGCPFDYELICASNGKSYDNRCLMEIASCELGVKLKIVKHGSCGKTLTSTNCHFNGLLRCDVMCGSHCLI